MKKRIWIKEIFIIIPFAILGAGAIVTIIVLENQKESSDIVTMWQNIIIGVSCSVVASVIFSIIQRLYKRNDEEQMIQQLTQIDNNLKQQLELYDNGIVSIHPKAYFDDEEIYWKNIIDGTEKRLDLIGHSISRWFKNEYREKFLSKIKCIVESGNDVNIILSADKIDDIMIRVKNAYMNPNLAHDLSKIEKTLLYFYAFLSKEVETDKLQHLKVYVTNLNVVTYLYIRTDDQCIISPYTHSLDNRQNSFLLELKPGIAYVKSLEDDFEEMIGKMRPMDFTIEKEVPVAG